MGSWWFGTPLVQIHFPLRTCLMHPLRQELLLPWQKSTRSPNTQVCIFCNLWLETTGVIGPDTLKFLKTLGRRIRETSGKRKSFPYLIQQLAVAIQRGNAASVMGTFESVSKDVSNLFFAPIGHQWSCLFLFSKLYCIVLYYIVFCLFCFVLFCCNLLLPCIQILNNIFT